MATIRNYRFSTERLIVDDWHSFSLDEWPQQYPAKAVREILTERVTQFLPSLWQGPYSLDRAQQWVNERDNEGVTLLAIEKADRHAVGMVVLFEFESSGNLRLGYMLKESAWRKGIAGEIIGGFVKWCRHNDICSITGGVQHGNIASRGVLEKYAFQSIPRTDKADEQLFTLTLR